MRKHHFKEHFKVGDYVIVKKINSGDALPFFQGRIINIYNDCFVAENLRGICCVAHQKEWCLDADSFLNTEGNELLVTKLYNLK